MQPVTLSKLVMIALVIGLGAAATSLASDSKFITSQLPTLHAMEKDFMRPDWPRKTAALNTRARFVERAPIPYFGVSGNLQNMEYEY